MTYPTFETRLVPISELKPVHDDSYLCYRNNWRLPCPCYFDPCVTDDDYDGWVQAENDEALFESPTHFLQFKINGEWTHEFNLGVSSETS